MRDGAIDISTIESESIAEAIKQYQEYYEKALAAKDASADLKDELAALSQTKFDNLAQSFADLMSGNEHAISMYEATIDLMEKRGYIASASLYDSLKEAETKNQDILKEKYHALSQALDEAVSSGTVTQSVPDDYVAWSVGGKKYSNCNVTGGGKYYGVATNANTLNIEICDDVKNGVVYPSASTIQNAIEFTKVKMAEYNLAREDVIRHFDVTGKSCPAYWVDDAKWKAEFWDKLSDTPTTTTPSTNTTLVPFLIKVDKVKIGDVLNVRQEPNADAKITAKLAYNDPNTYTIIEVKNGWGLLKSKLGWINLNYTKRVSTATNKSASTPTPMPAPQPAVQQSIDAWAREVIAGKHGNGHANRESSLKRAGCAYSYSQVRARVNALLK